MFNTPMQNTERVITESVFPCHLLWVATAETRKLGYSLRMDVQDKLNTGAAVPLARLKPLAISRVASKVDSLVTLSLEVVGADDPRHGLYTAAMLVLVLIEEGLFKDPSNVSVTVALLLLEELKEDGHTDGYGYDEARLKTDAKRMLQRLRLQGMYPNTLLVLA